ncbi:MAG TPA: hypothetical protein VFV75_18345 [Candidatus Polarisedimenticolaceae bacterium]|nr:hypothetical protein [Candidatus Polarisedimenticolaceae bacterium]
MTLRRALHALVLLACLAPIARAGDGPAEVRQAAQSVGQALQAKQTGALRKLLPQKGKVELSLARLGPEDGAFAPPQVEALFRDFLASGSVRSFEVVRVEGECKVHGVAHARAALVDRQGSPARVGLHLTFQLEEGRWVLRGMRETAE